MALGVHASESNVSRASTQFAAFSGFVRRCARALEAASPRDDRVYPVQEPLCYVSFRHGGGLESPLASRFVASTALPAAWVPSTRPDKEVLEVSFFLGWREVFASHDAAAFASDLDARSAAHDDRAVPFLFVCPYAAPQEVLSTEPYLVLQARALVRVSVEDGNAPVVELIREPGSCEHGGRAPTEEDAPGQGDESETNWEAFETCVARLAEDARALGCVAVTAESAALPDAGAVPVESRGRTRDGTHASTSPTESASGIDTARVRQALATAQEGMRRGDCYLLNYSARLPASFPGAATTGGNPRLDGFLVRYFSRPARFGFYCASPKRAFAVFSPERFLAMEGDAVLTEPIKGTAPAGRDADETSRNARSLWDSPKERHEQTMVVDLLRHDLNAVCRAGSVTVHAPFFVRKAGALLQMQSFIEGRVRPELGLGQVLARMLPAGSVTGTPKRKACEIIAGIEDTPRGYYTGIAGLVSGPRRCDSFILIRGVFARQAHCYVGVGVGVTALSDPEAEIDELNAKFASFAVAPPEPARGVTP